MVTPIKVLVDNILPRLPSPFCRARLTPIALGKSGCLVYRLHAENATAVLKVSARDLMPDYLRLGHPHSDTAEYMYYTRLLPSLHAPAPRLLASGELGEAANYVLLEDIAQHYFIPALDHQWTTAEMLAVVEVYAALHGRAPRALAECESLGWLKQDPRQEFKADEAYTLLSALYENSWTRSAVAPVIRHPRLEHNLNDILNSLAHLPTTLLHNDFYPLNIGLPRQYPGQALLLDYQLIGLGPGMLDILNIGFLHAEPHFKHIQSEAVLSHYLRHLQPHTGDIAAIAEFRRAYPYAVMLGWADYLPRLVRAMRGHNRGTEPWNAWLQQTMTRAMREWAQALA